MKALMMIGIGFDIGDALGVPCPFLEVLSQHSTALLFIDLQVKTLPRILRQETSVTLVVFFLGGAVSEVHLHITLFGGFYATPTSLSSSFTFVQDIWGLVFTRGRHTPAGSHVVGILQQVWTMKSARLKSRSFVLFLNFVSSYGRVWSKYRESVLNGYIQSFVNIRGRNVIFLYLKTILIENTLSLPDLA